LSGQIDQEDKLPALSWLNAQLSRLRAIRSMFMHVVDEFDELSLILEGRVTALHKKSLRDAS